MSVMPAQRNGYVPTVTIAGDTLEITHLRVGHPDTVALARAELAERGPAALADTVANAITVGMVAARLHRGAADPTAALQRVLDGFDQQLRARATDTTSRLEAAITRIDATEQAARTAAVAALAELPARVEAGLASALAAGGVDVREAVRGAVATAHAEGLAQLDRVARASTEQVRSLVSMENPASPLAALRRDLTTAVDAARRELSGGLAEVRALVQAAQAEHAATRKTPTVVGREWEDYVSDVVSMWAAATGDVVHAVGSQPAPGSTRKTGDVVIEVMAGSRPRVVIEAKGPRQRALTARQLTEELAEARRVRSAVTGLAVVAAAEHVPGPGRLARLGPHDWVLAGDDPELVTLVLAVIRELTLVESLPAASEGLDVGRAHTAIGHALQALNRFDLIAKNVGAAETALGRIRGTADQLRSGVAGHLAEAARALRVSDTG